MPAPQEILDSIDDRFDATIEDLIELARIPSVSAAGFDPAQVERSAEKVAELFSDAGLHGVEILRIDDAHPYATAEWLDAG
ncbi:MAG: dipeptidase, partial [Deltaproteobacteria bacterium]|nr:dipeptidase [Deltaproteobacteria bacterium]